MGKRQGRVWLRVYNSCARSNSAWIHLVGSNCSQWFLNALPGSKSEDLCIDRVARLRE